MTKPKPEPAILEIPFIEDRTPILEKIGYYFLQGSRGERSFKFFVSKGQLKNNDVFIYNKGILWRLKR